jgi:hypothetical protein
MTVPLTDEAGGNHLVRLPSTRRHAQEPVEAHRIRRARLQCALVFFPWSLVPATKMQSAFLVFLFRFPLP